MFLFRQRIRGFFMSSSVENSNVNPKIDTFFDILKDVIASNDWKGRTVTDQTSSKIYSSEELINLFESLLKDQKSEEQLSRIRCKLEGFKNPNDPANFHELLETLESRINNFHPKEKEISEKKKNNQQPQDDSLENNDTTSHDTASSENETEFSQQPDAKQKNKEDLDNKVSSNSGDVPNGTTIRPRKIKQIKLIDDSEANKQGTLLNPKWNLVLKVARVVAGVAFLAGLTYFVLPFLVPVAPLEPNTKVCQTVNNVSVCVSKEDHPAFVHFLENVDSQNIKAAAEIKNLNEKFEAHSTYYNQQIDEIKRQKEAETKAKSTCEANLKTAYEDLNLALQNRTGYDDPVLRQFIKKVLALEVPDFTKVSTIDDLAYLRDAAVPLADLFVDGTNINRAEKDKINRNSWRGFLTEYLPNPTQISLKDDPKFLHFAAIQFANEISQHATSREALELAQDVAVKYLPSVSSTVQKEAIKIYFSLKARKEYINLESALNLSIFFKNIENLHVNNLELIRLSINSPNFSAEKITHLSREEISKFVLSNNHKNLPESHIKFLDTLLIENVMAKGDFESVLTTIKQIVTSPLLERFRFEVSRLDRLSENLLKFEKLESSKQKIITESIELTANFFAQNKLSEEAFEILSDLYTSSHGFEVNFDEEQQNTLRNIVNKSVFTLTNQFINYHKLNNPFNKLLSPEFQNELHKIVLKNLPIKESTPLDSAFSLLNSFIPGVTQFDATLPNTVTTNSTQVEISLVSNEIKSKHIVDYQNYMLNFTRIAKVTAGDNFANMHQFNQHLYNKNITIQHEMASIILDKYPSFIEAGSIHTDKGYNILLDFLGNVDRVGNNTDTRFESKENRDRAAKIIDSTSFNSNQGFSAFHQLINRFERLKIDPEFKDQMTGCLLNKINTHVEATHSSQSLKNFILINDFLKPFLSLSNPIKTQLTNVTDILASKSLPTAISNDAFASLIRLQAYDAAVNMPFIWSNSTSLHTHEKERLFLLIKHLINPNEAAINSNKEGSETFDQSSFEEIKIELNDSQKNLLKKSLQSLINTFELTSDRLIEFSQIANELDPQFMLTIPDETLEKIAAKGSIEDNVKLIQFFKSVNNKIQLKNQLEILKNVKPEILTEDLKEAVTENWFTELLKYATSKGPDAYTGPIFDKNEPKDILGQTIDVITHNGITQTFQSFASYFFSWIPSAYEVGHKVGLKEHIVSSTNATAKYKLAIQEYTAILADPMAIESSGIEFDGVILDFLEKDKTENFPDLINLYNTYLEVHIKQESYKTYKAQIDNIGASLIMPNNQESLNEFISKFKEPQNGYLEFYRFHLAAMKLHHIPPYQLFVDAHIPTYMNCETVKIFLKINEEYVKIGSTDYNTALKGNKHNLFTKVIADSQSSLNERLTMLINLLGKFPEQRQLQIDDYLDSLFKQYESYKFSSINERVNTLKTFEKEWISEADWYKNKIIEFKKDLVNQFTNDLMLSANSSAFNENLRSLYAYSQSSGNNNADNSIKIKHEDIPEIIKNSISQLIEKNPMSLFDKLVFIKEVINTKDNALTLDNLPVEKIFGQNWLNELDLKDKQLSKLIKSIHSLPLSKEKIESSLKNLLDPMIANKKLDLKKVFMRFEYIIKSFNLNEDDKASILQHLLNESAKKVTNPVNQMEIYLEFLKNDSDIDRLKVFIDKLKIFIKDLKTINLKSDTISECIKKLHNKIMNNSNLNKIAKDKLIQFQNDFRTLY